NVYYFLQDPNNGLIKAVAEYSDPTKPWLSSFSVESAKWGSGPAQYSEAAALPPNYNECQYTSTAQNSPYPPPPSSAPWTLFYDGNKKVFYKGVLNGGWLPYGLVTPFNANKPDQVGMGTSFCAVLSGGCPSIYVQVSSDAREFVTFERLPSMELVITPDKTKWSRCIVIEASPSASLSALVRAGYPRVAKWRLSRDVIQGDTLAYRNEPLSISSQGFSWFPGYAVNLETGERVNVLFAEASWFKGENGDDMLFNPTSSAGSSGDAYGGRHWIFLTTYPYDECRKFAEWLCVADSTPTLKTPVGQERGLTFRKQNGDTVRIDSFLKYIAWMDLPKVASPQYEFKHYKDIPTEVRIRIGVNKAFASSATGEPPTFEFSTSEIATRTGQKEVAKNALDLIRIVPNPFYGRSGVGRGRYEISQVDSRAKLVNLPKRCTIRIFTLNGVLVRTFRKDTEETFLEWDLKNEYGVPIASGVYIIHIDAPELGEKVIKFFAIMPQVDLNNY
ncbi:MAG: hypothetical protein NZ933_07750, partial [Bacteroidia bacterium]|nr:hypothetical protein [Bacteroidia bacterium]